MVKEIRGVPQWKKMGTPKLYSRLKPKLDKLGIKMGRDALDDLLREYGLQVRRRRKKAQTTNSKHSFHYYDNLIKGIIPDKPGMIWVSDITYLNLPDEFLYLFLITDLYSHKIIGFCLAPTLHAHWAVKALEMALQQWQPTPHGLIHHSDRGIQYSCPQYTSYIKQHQIAISMAAKGNPYENPVAERINGILKDEMALNRVFTNYQQAYSETVQTITMYNEERQHKSINDLTPEVAHTLSGPIPKKW